jgi:DUF2934 family protein
MAPTMVREIEEEIANSNAEIEFPQISSEEIAKLAYSIWEARGGTGGCPESDWLAAEAELRQR